MIRLAKRILGMPSEQLNARWLEHVRAYPRFQSKPDPGPFDNSVVTESLSRKLGRHSGYLRRRSGIFLPSPVADSATRFKLWEMPGETHETRLPNALLGQDLHDTFLDYHPSFSSRRSFVMRIPHGSFHGQDHTLFDADFLPIDWEPPYWALNCGLPGTMFRRRLGHPKRLRGRALVLSAPAAGGNIWHFLFDSLPKLKLLSDSGGDPAEFDHILIDSLRMPYVAEAIEHLGMDRTKIVETEVHPFVTADELTHITIGGLLPPDPWVLRWLRERFLPAGLPEPSRHILICREHATRRKLVGEPEIKRTLVRAGFEAVYLERHSLREQIGFFASAKTVVSTHGAGLTNLVWSHPGAKVIELFAAEYINVCYWNIAQMLGLEYTHAVGVPSTPGDWDQRAVLDISRLQTDIVLPDIDELIGAILRSAGLRPAAAG